jgi:peptide/nickel transport system ATP-binding protein
MTALLEIKRLQVDIPFGDARRVLLRDVNLTIHQGEAVGLVGESGSGKSMTARAITHQLPANAVARGSVRFDETDVLALRGPVLTEFRRKEIGMIFQDPGVHINPVRTIGDFVTEEMRDSGVSRKAARARAQEMLRAVQLPTPGALLDRYPHELSGGMLQRVMIAAALIERPRLVLADEPTTALDVTTQSEIMAILGSLRKEFGVALLFITHDLDLAATTCDRTVVMYAGAVVEEQASLALHSAPLHPYTRALLDSRPQLERATRRLTTIPGNPRAAYDVVQGCSFQPRCTQWENECLAVEPVFKRSGRSGVACHFAQPGDEPDGGRQ